MSHLATQNGAVAELDHPNATIPQLSVSDRCDSCGAQAYVHVTVKTGELMFCAHHGKKYHDKLSPIAFRWHDESSRLSD